MIRRPRTADPITLDRTAMFQKNIRAFRKERDLSLDEAAVMIGCSPKQLHNIETGKRGIPGLKILKGLARTYGRRIEDLDSSKPGPPDERLYAAVTYSIAFTHAEQALIPDDIRWAFTQFAAIDERLKTQLRAAKLKLLQRPRR